MKRLRRKRGACARTRFLPIIERLEERVLLTIPVMPPRLEGGLLRNVSAAYGQDPGASLFSSTGVRYADGAVEVPGADLPSVGFGPGWGFDRVWSNNSAYAAGNFNGSGWVDTQLPHLVDLYGDSSTIIVLTHGTDARYFDKIRAIYTERLFLPEKLRTGTGELVLTDSSGDQLHFFDFSASPAAQRGQLKSFVDPYGNVSNVNYDATGKVTTIQQAFQSVSQTYTFTYVSSGTNAGLLQNVTVNHGSDPAFRQVVYSYYDGTTGRGNAGDLMTAQIQQIKDGVITPIDTYYYRYYTSGFVHGLKYAVNPDSYARLKNSVGDPTTASDSDVGTYADLYFEYDGQGRVTRQDVQGAGASSGTGIGKYTFAYTASSNPAGTNSWQVNTTIALPDNSNQQIVYTNSYGEPMLDVFVSGGNKWENFTKYDDIVGRVILTANPSALTGYDDSKADLLNSVNGTYTYRSFAATKDQRDSLGMAA
jgi:hypothetical protein